MRSLKILLVIALIVCLIVSFAEAAQKGKKKGKGKNQHQPQGMPAVPTSDPSDVSNGGKSGAHQKVVVETKEDSSSNGKGKDLPKKLSRSDAVSKRAFKAETAKLIATTIVEAITLFSIDHLLPLGDVTSTALVLVGNFTETVRAIATNVSNSDMVNATLEHETVKSALNHATVKSITASAFFTLEVVVAFAIGLSFLLVPFLFRRLPSFLAVVSFLRHVSFGVVFGLMTLSLALFHEMITAKWALTSVFLSSFFVAALKPHYLLHFVALVFSVVTIGYFHFYDDGKLHFNYERSFITREPIKSVHSIIANAMKTETK